MMRSRHRILFVLTITLWGLITTAHAANLSKKEIHDTLYSFHRMMSIEWLCAYYKIRQWTTEDQNIADQLTSAIHKEIPLGDPEYYQLLDEINKEISNSKEYKTATSYGNYLESLLPPLDRGPQGLRPRFTDSEWRADKEVKRAELFEWCATSDKKFREVMDDFVNHHVVPISREQYQAR